MRGYRIQESAIRGKAATSTSLHPASCQPHCYAPAYAPEMLRLRHFDRMRIDVDRNDPLDLLAAA